MAVVEVPYGYKGMVSSGTWVSAEEIGSKQYEPGDPVVDDDDVKYLWGIAEYIGERNPLMDSDTATAQAYDWIQLHRAWPSGRGEE